MSSASAPPAVVVAVALARACSPARVAAVAC